MTHEVVTCVAEDRAAGIMAVMMKKHLRHIPVVREGELVTMVSIRDLLQLRLDEVRSEADAMRSYITGELPPAEQAGSPADDVRASGRQRHRNDPGGMAPGCLQPLLPAPGGLPHPDQPFCAAACRAISSPMGVLQTVGAKPGPLFATSRSGRAAETGL